jgi:hypothetical protein
MQEPGSNAFIPNGLLLNFQLLLTFEKNV